MAHFSWQIFPDSAPCVQKPFLTAHLVGKNVVGIFLDTYPMAHLLEEKIQLGEALEERKLFVQKKLLMAPPFRRNIADGTPAVRKNMCQEQRYPEW